MKKLMFAAALAASLTGLADITSANTVGYISRDIEAETFYMVAAQFENVGEDAVADFNKVISLKNIKAVSIDDAVKSGAEIQVRVGSKYNHYYYINDAWDEHDEEVAGDVWADGEGYIITEADLLALGDGFWFVAHGDSASAGASITVNGEVSSANELSKDVAGTTEGWFSIVANPFPMGTDLNKITTTGLTAVSIDDAVKSGNEIQVRYGSKYNHYYYINDAWDEHDEEVPGDVWADGEGYIVTDADIIAAGSSFWVNGRQNGKLIFTK